MSSITYEEANRIITIIHTHLLRFGANQHLCDALLMAKKATEKQIPKKPTDKFELIAPSYWVCCNCEKAMMSKDASGIRFDCCPYCGQVIDWSE